MRRVSTIVNCLSKLFLQSCAALAVCLTYTYLFGVAKRANPIIFRLPKPETRALHAFAASHGVSANRYMKRLALELLGSDNSWLTDIANESSVMPNAPMRSQIAPENRAAPDRPAIRGGFAEKIK